MRVILKIIIIYIIIIIIIILFAKFKQEGNTLQVVGKA